MRLDELKYCYFLGIGGIGMSALARYFHAIGVQVSGYDKTSSPLTDALKEEGIAIGFEDSGELIGARIPNGTTTLIVWTPAVPLNHGELTYFRENEYQLMKRAEVLGLITRGLQGFAVAGTHGKTTTSTMLAFVMQSCGVDVNAFLGGIASNFDSNLVMNAKSNIGIVEADEFDRSFLHLRPYAAIITSTEADHLDIYGEAKTLVNAFQDFALLIDEAGYLVVHQAIQLTSNCEQVEYGLVADFHQGSGVYGKNIRVINRRFWMDVKAFGQEIGSIELGVPGLHNAENALAVIAVALKEGLSVEAIKQGLKSFKGVRRRFDVHVEKEHSVYIDDYAHHPTAIRFLLNSVKLLYPTLPIIVVFQPHLFSRTRDFLSDFAAELSQADELILLPIYPARELPIDGITSEVLCGLASAKKKAVCSHEEVLDRFKSLENAVLVTVGAGDIDRLVEPLKRQLS